MASCNGFPNRCAWIKPSKAMVVREPIDEQILHPPVAEIGTVTVGGLVLGYRRGTTVWVAVQRWMKVVLCIGLTMGILEWIIDSLPAGTAVLRPILDVSSALMYTSFFVVVVLSSRTSVCELCFR